MTNHPTFHGDVGRGEGPCPVVLERLAVAHGTIGLVADETGDHGDRVVQPEVCRAGAGGIAGAVGGHYCENKVQRVNFAAEMRVS